MTIAIILGLLAFFLVPAAYVASILNSYTWAYRCIITAMLLWAPGMLTFAGVLLYRVLI